MEITIMKNISNNLPRSESLDLETGKMRNLPGRKV